MIIYVGRAYGAYAYQDTIHTITVIQKREGRQGIPYLYTAANLEPVGWAPRLFD